MIQLGLSAFYHDSAAALVIDGKVICAIEEENYPVKNMIVLFRLKQSNGV